MQDQVVVSGWCWGGARDVSEHISGASSALAPTWELVERQHHLLDRHVAGLGLLSEPNLLQRLAC